MPTDQPLNHPSNLPRANRPRGGPNKKERARMKRSAFKADRRVARKALARLLEASAAGASEIRASGGDPGVARALEDAIADVEASYLGNWAESERPMPPPPRTQKFRVDIRPEVLAPWEPDPADFRHRRWKGDLPGVP